MKKPILYLALTLLLTPYAAMHAASSDVLTQNPAPIINVPNPEADKGAKAKAQEVDFETVSMGVRFGFLCLDLAVSAVVAVVAMVLVRKFHKEMNKINLEFLKWLFAFWIYGSFFAILTFWALSTFNAFKHAAGMKLVNGEGKRLTPREYWKYVGVKSQFRGDMVGVVMGVVFIVGLLVDLGIIKNKDNAYLAAFFLAMVALGSAVGILLSEAISAAVRRRLPYTKGIYYVKASVYKELQARTAEQENKEEANSPLPAAA